VFFKKRVFRFVLWCGGVVGLLFLWLVLWFGVLVLGWWFGGCGCVVSAVLRLIYFLWFFGCLFVCFCCVLGVCNVCKIVVRLKIGRHRVVFRDQSAFFCFLFHLAIICLFFVLLFGVFLVLVWCFCFVVLCCGCPK
jgi:hypothetical protein